MEMNRTVILLAMTAALAGCAAPTPRPKAPPPVVTSEAPRCRDAGGECARMWIAAQQTAENLSGMRLRMVTDTRIETFPPRDFGRTGVIVVKYPLQDGSFELQADFECYGSTDCSRLRPLGINAFNTRVALSADRPWQKK